MVTLVTVFGFCFLVALGLLLLKSVEISRGQALFLGRFRNVIDTIVLRTPTIISRDARLGLARVSLFAHSMSSGMHTGVGEVRRFFRQRAIKFLTSAHRQNIENGEHHGVSYYLRRLAERRSTISRE